MTSHPSTSSRASSHIRRSFPATLFDYNGVLADDEVVHLEAFRDALTPLGIGVTEQDYVEKYLGFDDRGAFRAIFQNAGRELSDAELDRLVLAKKPLYFARARQHLPVFPGAAALVALCAEHGPVGVVSGALRDEIELGLQTLGVTEHVQFVVSAEDTRACKPDPEGYLIGLQQLARLVGEETAQRALVIEDSLAGVEAARAARLTCVAVAHSYPKARLEAAGAHWVVDNLSELNDDLLESLYQRVHG